MQIKPEEVDVFLKGGGALDITSVRKKPKVGEGYTCPSLAHDCPAPPVCANDLAQQCCSGDRCQDMLDLSSQLGCMP